MPHKADRSWFDCKRAWSERKDHILAYYLQPYLAKVSRLGRPILIVDGFAGPGKFGDGKIGSPLIICSKVIAAVKRGANVSVLCIEADPELLEQLRHNLSAFSFARAEGGEFLDHVSHIEHMARSHTVFLYVDPWAVEGLNWSALDRVFRLVNQVDASVELLLNFNADSFVRRGLAVLKREVPSIDPELEDPEEIDVPFTESPSATRLTQIIGAPWWKEVLNSSSDFANLVHQITDRFCDQLRKRFHEVGQLPIRAKQSYKVPKYFLIFASRHPDGLELMNDAMAKSRGTSIFYLDMFSRSELEQIIRRLSADWVPRGSLIIQVMREAFCMFTRSEIRGCIEELLKSSALESSTKKVRINDTVEVRCS